jgi:cytochrome c
MIEGIRNSLKVLALAAALALSGMPALAETEAPDLERGEKLWGKCKACHTYEKGGRHIVGPNLWNIFGKQAGTAEGYTYSEAMVNSDVVWTEETLDAYLAATQDFMPGSKMYGGLAIEQNRIDLLAWLKTVTEE